MTRMTRQELIAGYEEWFCTKRWHLFGTLTFAAMPSPSRADSIFRRWISEIKSTDGTSDFSWVRVAEHGADGQNLHYHVLVGGWAGESKWPWVLRWNELAGDCIISYYDPNGGGLRYLLKTVQPNRDFEIEFEFPLPGRPKQ